MFSLLNPLNTSCTRDPLKKKKTLSASQPDKSNEACLIWRFLSSDFEIMLKVDCWKPSGYGSREIYLGLGSSRVVCNLSHLQNSHSFKPWTGDIPHYGSIIFWWCWADAGNGFVCGFFFRLSLFHNACHLDICCSEMVFVHLGRVPLQYHMDSVAVILYVCAAETFMDFIIQFHAYSVAIEARKWNQISGSNWRQCLNTERKRKFN